MANTPAVVMVVVALGSGVSRCGSIRQREDFSAVAAADRIDVQDVAAKRIGTITDPTKVKAAAAFIIAHPDDWSEPLAGGAAPRLQLQFFRADQPLRGFGMSDSYLTEGSLSRPTPPDEIAALMRQLDLRWP